MDTIVLKRIMTFTIYFTIINMIVWFIGILININPIICGLSIIGIFVTHLIPTFVILFIVVYMRFDLKFNISYIKLYTITTFILIFTSFLLFMRNINDFF